MRSNRWPVVWIASLAMCCFAAPSALAQEQYERAGYRVELVEPSDPDFLLQDGASAVMLGPRTYWTGRGCFVDDGAGLISQLGEEPAPHYTEIVHVHGRAEVIVHEQSPSRGVELTLSGCREPEVLLRVEPSELGGATQVLLADDIAHPDHPLTLATPDAIYAFDWTSPGSTPEKIITAREMHQLLLDQLGRNPYAAPLSADAIAAASLSWGVRVSRSSTGHAWWSMTFSIQPPGANSAYEMGWIVRRSDGGGWEVVILPDEHVMYGGVNRAPLRAHLVPQFDLVRFGNRMFPASRVPTQSLERGMLQTYASVFDEFGGPTGSRRIAYDGFGNAYAHVFTPAFGNTPASFEIFELATDPEVFDLDQDGLSAAREASLGTSDADPDSDGDGVHDAAELFLGSSPTVADAPAVGARAVVGSATTPVDFGPLQQMALDPAAPVRRYETPGDGSNADGGGVRGSSSWLQLNTSMGAPLARGMCMIAPVFNSSPRFVECYTPEGTPIVEGGFPAKTYFEPDGERVWMPSKGNGVDVFEAYLMPGLEPDGESLEVRQQDQFVPGFSGAHVVETVAGGFSSSLLTAEGGSLGPARTSLPVRHVRFLGYDTLHRAELFEVTLDGTYTNVLAAMRGGQLEPLVSTQYLARAAELGSWEPDLRMSQIVTLPDGSGYLATYSSQLPNNTGDLYQQSLPAYVVLDELFRPRGRVSTGLRVRLAGAWNHGVLGTHDFELFVENGYKASATACSESGDLIFCPVETTTAMPVFKDKQVIPQELIVVSDRLAPGELLLAGAHRGLWRMTSEGAVTSWLTRAQIERLIGQGMGPDYLVPQLQQIVSVNVRDDLGRVCVVDPAHGLFELELDGAGHVARAIERKRGEGLTACAYDGDALVWGGAGGEIWRDGELVGDTESALVSLQRTPRGWIAVGDAGTRCLDETFASVHRDQRLAGATLGPDELVWAVSTDGASFVQRLDDFCAGQTSPRQNLYSFGSKLWFNLYLYANQSVGGKHELTASSAHIAVMDPGHVFVLPGSISGTPLGDTVSSRLFRLLPQYHDLSNEFTEELGDWRLPDGHFARATEVVVTAMARVPGEPVREPVDYLYLGRDEPVFDDGGMQMEERPARVDGDEGDGRLRDERERGCAAAGLGQEPGSPWKLLGIFGLLAWCRRRRARSFALVVSALLVSGCGVGGPDVKGDCPIWEEGFERVSKGDMIVEIEGVDVPGAEQWQIATRTNGSTLELRACVLGTSPELAAGTVYETWRWNTTFILQGDVSGGESTKLWGGVPLSFAGSDKNVVSGALSRVELDCDPTTSSCKAEPAELWSMMFDGSSEAQIKEHTRGESLDAYGWIIADGGGPKVHFDVQISF